jgi:hypothetical protein
MRRDTPRGASPRPPAGTGGRPMLELLEHEMRLNLALMAVIHDQSR